MTLLACERPLAEAHDAALVDLDGVAYRGPEPIAHAADNLVAARDGGMRLVFVTNNASREPQTVAAHLSELGIPTAPDEVLTAAQAAGALLAERLPPGSRVLVVGGAGLLTAVRAAGLEVVTSADDAPDAVVQGFAPEVGWRQLAEAAYAVQRGAWYVASNLDLTLPNERGTAPGNGSLVGVVRAATGVEPVSAGKPEPSMFRLAAERVGARRPLVVGDRLDTDLAGARAAGMPGLHVLTGVSSLRDAVLAGAHERPSYLGLDLRSLGTPHPAPTREGDWWVCRGAAATVRAGSLVLDERAASSAADDGLDAGRAACAAVWSASDAGIAVEPGSVPMLATPEPAG